MCCCRGWRCGKRRDIRCSVLSRFWIIMTLVCFTICVSLAAAGYTAPRLLPFTEALLAAVFSVFFTLGIAILVIEGPTLTRLGRRNKIIERMSRAIITHAAEKISWSTLELGRWLGSVLPEQVDVNEEINKFQNMKWESSVNPALREVFLLAENVRAIDIESINPIPEDEYKEILVWRKNITTDIRRRMESNLDVYERLFELSDALERLEQVITHCWWPENIREEEKRFHSLGRLGIACIDFHESLNRIHRRL